MGLGSGIRDLGSGKKPIPDPGVKKAPDPGSGSATLAELRIRIRLGVYLYSLPYAGPLFRIADPDPKEIFTHQNS